MYNTLVFEFDFGERISTESLFSLSNFLKSYLGEEYAEPKFSVEEIDDKRFKLASKKRFFNTASFKNKSEDCLLNSVSVRSDGLTFCSSKMYTTKMQESISSVVDGILKQIQLLDGVCSLLCNVSSSDCHKDNILPVFASKDHYYTQQIQCHDDIVNPINNSTTPIRIEANYSSLTHKEKKITLTNVVTILNPPLLGFGPSLLNSYSNDIKMLTKKLLDISINKTVSVLNAIIVEQNT